MSRVFWSFYGVFYDAIWNSVIPQRIADAVASRLPEGADALDFGCGTGLVSRRLLARGHRVMAVDPSTAMLRRARSGRRATEFFHSDAPPPGRRFSSAVAVNVLHLVDSPERVLHSLFAVADGPVFAVWPEDEVSLIDLAEWEREGGRSLAWIFRAASCRILVGIPGVLLRVRTVAEVKLHRLSVDAAAKASKSVEFVSVPGTGCVMAIFTNQQAGSAELGSRRRHE